MSASGRVKNRTARPYGKTPISHTKRGAPRRNGHAAPGYYVPLLVLVALLLCSLWNAHAISAHSRRLLEQLDSAEQSARAGQWEAAARTMETGYQDWRDRRNYLHMVSRHDASNGADALYRRCILFARAGDEVSFLTELETLREQLRTLTEMEQFSLGNIL